MNISQKIKLVFAEERRLYGIPSKVTIGSLNIGEFVPTGLLAATSELGYVKSINADRLLKLHSMLDQQGRQHFESYLFGHLRNGIIPESQLSYLSFLVLHRLGQTIAAVQAARHYYTSAGKSGPPGRDRRPFGNVAVTLSALIATEYGQMSGAWCEELHAALGTEISFLPSLRDRLNQVLLMHLDAELGDANPEIFADRDRVISIWERKFGDPTIPAVIAEIDQYFSSRRNLRGEASNVRFSDPYPPGEGGPRRCATTCPAGRAGRVAHR
jgi:hypothetical protein